MPASSAPTGLPRPPSTTTMKPMIEYSAPEKGLKAGKTSATSTPVTPAMAEASAKAKAESLTTSTPTILIASGFMVAARSALPGSVRDRYAVHHEEGHDLGVVALLQARQQQVVRAPAHGEERQRRHRQREKRREAEVAEQRVGEERAAD